MLRSKVARREAEFFFEEYAQILDMNKSRSICDIFDVEIRFFQQLLDATEFDSLNLVVRAAAKHFFETLIEDSAGESNSTYHIIHVDAITSMLANESDGGSDFGIVDGQDVGGQSSGHSQRFYQIGIWGDILASHHPIQQLRG